MPQRPQPVPVALVGAGEPVPVNVHHPDATLGDLLAAVGGLTGAPLAPVVDGVVRPEGQCLRRLPLRAGTVLGGPPSAPVAACAPVLRFVTGPDAGRVAPLPGTGAVVGRDPSADVPVADPLASPFEVLLEPAGPAWSVQALAPGAAAGVLLPGDEVRVGGSLAVLDLAGGERPALPPPGPGGTVARPVAGPAAEAVEEAPAPLPVAEAAGTGSPGGSLALLVGPAVAGVVLAVVLHQPMLLALALLGALGTALSSVLGRAGGRVRATRRRRRRQADEAVAAARHAAAEQARRRRRPDLGAALRAAAGDGLWLVGPGGPGWGEVAAGRAPDGGVVTVDVLGGRTVAILGPPEPARAVARALLVQVAAHHGPAHLAVAVPAGPAWAWAAWLPHVTVPGRPHTLRVDDRTDGSRGLPGDHDVGACGRLLLVTDQADVPAGAQVLVVDGPWLGVPDDPAASGAGRAPLGAGNRTRWAGCSMATAAHAARSLARWSQPLDGGDALPPAVALADLLPADPCDPAALAAVWRAPTGAVRAPLGIGAGGEWWLDLPADGPHLLVGGTTGSGKSELLRSLVLGLAALHPPSRVAFVLVDHKGGSALAPVAGLPHVAGSVTDLDDDLAARALAGLRAEVREREEAFRAAGAEDLAAYDRARAAAPALAPVAGLPHVAGSVTDLDDDLAARALAGLRAEVREREEAFRSAGAEDLAAYERARAAAVALAPLPRLVVVVDELAALATERPAFLRALVDVARRGRSLGLHLVLATQRPAGVITDDLRANTSLRIALRLPDPADSTDVVGDPGAATLDRTIPGRALVRRGPGELEAVQVATTAVPRRPDRQARVTVGGPAASVADPHHLARAVAAACAAAGSLGEAPARPLWLPALPEHLPVGEVAPGCVGLLDDPAGRRRVDLGWGPGDGNLLIAGPDPAATAEAVRAVVRALAGRPDAAPVYAIGDAPVDGAVDRVAPSDVERVARLLRTLRGHAGGRGRAEAGGRVVLAVEGIDRLRAVLDDPPTAALAEDLAHLVAHGRGAGVTVVATASRPALVPGAVGGAFAARWLLGALDPTEAALLGVPPSAPVAPGAVADAASGLAGRLASAGDLPTPPLASERWPASAPVGRLPERVEPRGPRPRRAGGGPVEVGVRAVDLEPATVELGPGDRFLVAGPPGSGRTSALAQLAGGAAVALGAALLAVEGRPGSLAAVLDSGCSCNDLDELAERLASSSGPVVLAVDDAERVDDPAGRLAGLLEHRDLVVVAAGRADALRGEYGHWTRAVRRSRAGLLLQPDREVDGELLGVVLPRVQLEPPCPGRGYLVGPVGAQLVQVALPPRRGRPAGSLRRIA